MLGKPHVLTIGSHYSRVATISHYQPSTAINHNDLPILELLKFTTSQKITSNGTTHQ
jgi:hypothetical protein